MSVINSEIRKARQEHECDFCQGKISKGNNYLDITISYDGEIYHDRRHATCNWIMKYLDSKYHLTSYEEMVDFEVFYEQIRKDCDIYFSDNNLEKINFDSKKDMIEFVVKNVYAKE